MSHIRLRVGYLSEHLKTKAKSMCDTLKCKDRLFIHPSHEIVNDGEVDRGSNIRDYIMDSLVEPPVPGTPKFTFARKENERLKRNLPYYEKALARARGLSRCRKFESIIDGTVDRCDFSDDTYSDGSSEEMRILKKAKKMTKVNTRTKKMRMVTQMRMMTRRKRTTNRLGKERRIDWKQLYSGHLQIYDLYSSTFIIRLEVDRDGY